MTSIAPIVRVHIGEVKTAADGESLKAILGSCVGIGLLFASRNIFGLAHCLLPEAPPDDKASGGKFVDKAIVVLLDKMSIEPADYRHVSAVLAGGAAVLTVSLTSTRASIGQKNVEQAERCLKQRRIPIVYRDVGDTHGRCLTIFGGDGTYCSTPILSY